MLTRRGRFVAAAAAVGAMCVATGLLVSGVSGCETTARTPGASSPPRSPTGSGSAEPRAQLAARAASAKDRSFTASYSLSPPDRGRRAITVTVAVAADGSWRTDLTGGGGADGDLALIGVASGQYQCRPSGTTGRECVLVARPGSALPALVDPGVQHPFTDWLDVLTDPTAAITVWRTANPAGATGDCFSVDATTVTLAPAIESSVFCYTDDGTLTAVQAAFGLLTSAGQPTAAPRSIGLPWPVTSHTPIPVVTAPATGRTSSTAQGESDRPR